MAKTELNPKVDAFLNKPSKWQAEFKTLREIAIGFELEETQMGQTLLCY